MDQEILIDVFHILTCCFSLIKIYDFCVVASSGIPPTPPPTVGPVPVITKFVEEFSCNFDAGFCGMTQDTVDSDDYILNSGPTPGNDTGPSEDHTTGQGKMVIENFNQSCC